VDLDTREQEDLREGKEEIKEDQRLLETR